jgi:hypothetical protein
MLTVIAGIFPSHLTAADDRPIRWIIKDGEAIDRAQAERLYREACRVIEQRFTDNTRVVRPRLTIHVGKSCPDSALSGTCLAPASGELYLPKWDDGAVGAITQATLVIGLLQLLAPAEVVRVTRSLLAEDARDFVDASSFRSRQKSRAGE